MKRITRIREVVCAMANKLKKMGYPLSQAFRKTWKRVKLSMTIVSGAGVIHMDHTCPCVELSIFR